MAHSKQAKKRIRQNEKRRLTNKTASSSMRTAVKRLTAICEEGDQAQAQEMLPGILSKIDKAAKTGVIHKNAASRKKSQVTRAVGSAGKS